MRKSVVIFAMLLFLINYKSFSQNYKDIMDKGIDVENGSVLYLRFDTQTSNNKSEKVLLYSFLKKENDFITLDTMNYFIIKNNSIPVFMEPINPLNFVLKSDFYTRIDPIQSNYNKGITEIITSLNQMQKALSNPAAIEDPNCNADIVKIINKLEEVNLSILNNKIQDINSIFNRLDALDFIAPLTVETALKVSASDIEKLKAFYSAQETLIQELKSLVDAFTCSVEGEDGKFKSFTVKSIISLKLIEINEERNTQLKRLANINDLKTLVEKVYTQAKGTNNSSWFIRLGEVKINRGEIGFFKVSLKDAGFVLANNEIVPVNEILNKSYNIKFRRYQNWIPDLTTGVAYVNNIKFYKYGTTLNENTGMLSVSEAGVEEVKRLNVTTMINFYNYKYAPENIYPFIQLGAGTNLESPALFLGGGLNFIGGNFGNLSFSAGGVGLFRKELDKLEVGQMIKGTADLENDLKYQPKVKYYFSLQWHLKTL